MAKDEMSEQNPISEEAGAGLEVSGPQELTLAVRKEPLAPRGMAQAEAQEMRARAATVAQQLEEASGAKEMEIIDSVVTVGVQAQRHAGGDLELLRTRVGNMLASEGTGGKVSKDMVDLRMTLNQINPHEMSHSGFRGVISALPLANRLNSMLAVLEKIAIRYQTVSQQVKTIESQLREGRMMLVRDNIELRMLYEQVEAQQVVIRKNGYLGELLMQQLEELLERTTDLRKGERVREALFDVSIRVQNLRAMDEVHVQLFVSIDMTRQNNTRLGQSVDQTLTLATNVVMVGLALQSALARQKRVMEANKRTREFIGDLLVANAASIKQHTAEIGDIYKEPVVAIDKLTQAHNDLIEAINLVDRLKNEGIDATRQNIATLNDLVKDLEERSRGLSEQREARSLEA